MPHSHPATAIALVAFIVTACGGTAPATPTAAPAATATATPALPTNAPTTTPAPTRSPGQMTHGRSFHLASVLAEGRVLVAGGYFDRYPIALADLYDPGTATFTATGSMVTLHGFGTATPLADARVLVTGGDPGPWNYEGAYIAAAELFDPAAGSFIPTGSLATARDLHTATLLSDGRVLIVGGNDTASHSLATAELYDPATGTFSRTGALAGPRGFHTATLLPDGRVLIVGGTSDSWGGAKVLASAEIYDPKTGRFTATGSMSTKRASHTATRLLDGRVLVVGGFAEGEVSLAAAELYDAETGTFSQVGNMADGRTFHDATLLADGRVLVSGGDPNGWGYDGPFLASAEIYDPALNAFVASGFMLDKLTNHTATLLPDGRVLIAGGYNGTADVADTELWDPATGAFTYGGVGG